MHRVGFCPEVCTQSSHRMLSLPLLAVTHSEVSCCHPTSYHWGAVTSQFPYLGQPGGRLSKGQGEIKGGVQGEPGGENNFLVSLRGLRNTVGVRRSFQVVFFGLVPETVTSDLWCRAPQGLNSGFSCPQGQDRGCSEESRSLRGPRPFPRQLGWWVRRLCPAPLELCQGVSHLCI